MKLALLSDIHANLRALEACLAHAASQGVTHHALLGDLVGYGAEPGAVVERARDLQSRGAWVLQGNHDALAVQPPAEVRQIGDSTAAWTHAQLDPGQRAYLAGLPLTHRSDSVLLVHASADAPSQWRYVQDARSAALSLDAAAVHPAVRHVFGGHVHHQCLYYRGRDTGLMQFNPRPGVPVPLPRHRHWLATVGSVGQPRDGNPMAMYAVFDAERLQLVFHRVPYDHPAAARAIRRAGLPAFFADRLETGR
ncbi:MAG: metallophosphoesterase [Rhodoferax sp.]|nr:metallophosphoesterase [Rhodoferax sp.]